MRIKTRVKRELSCPAGRITLVSLNLRHANRRANRRTERAGSKSPEVGDGDLHDLAYPWVIRMGIRAGH